LVKALAELHGGDLRLESRLGAGTTVTISFPPDRTAGPSAQEKHAVNGG
jgi:signal transduction histidine kinase